MRSDVLVIGAGISGIACARRCAAAGLSVQVVDRGRRLGGRLATRTLREGAEHPADQGAPYFTVSDDGFRGLVDGWVERDLVRGWTDTFHTAGPNGIGDAKPGPLRYTSTRGLRAVVEDLATGLDVVHGETAPPIGAGRGVGHHHARAVVLAMPGPQAARLLADHHADLAAVADQPYDPTLVLSARYERRDWADLDAAFVHGVDELRLVIDDGRSRGDGAPVLVAHSTPDFARRFLDDPEAARAPMLKALRGVLGASTDPLEAHVQRWTFAQPTGGRETTFHLSADRIGLCGDGWSAKSRVEAAWRSGDDLGAALVELFVL